MPSPDSAPVITTTSRPSLHVPVPWHVLLHDDDFTPIDFVVDLLVALFRIAPSEAARLAMQVHTNGRAIVTQCTKEIALTKVSQVSMIAERYQHPLLATAEPIG